MDQNQRNEVMAGLEAVRLAAINDVDDALRLSTLATARVGEDGGVIPSTGMTVWRVRGALAAARTIVRLRPGSRSRRAALLAEIAIAGLLGMLTCSGTSRIVSGIAAAERHGRDEHAREYAEHSLAATRAGGG